MSFVVPIVISLQKYSHKTVCDIANGLIESNYNAFQQNRQLLVVSQKTKDQTL